MNPRRCATCKWGDGAEDIPRCNHPADVCNGDAMTTDGGDRWQPINRERRLHTEGK